MNVSIQIKWLVFITLLVNAAAMLTPVINAGDSVLYAALSQHIVLSNNWADLILNGQDWLDKPSRVGTCAHAETSSADLKS